MAAAAPVSLPLCITIGGVPVAMGTIDIPYRAESTPTGVTLHLDRDALLKGLLADVARVLEAGLEEPAT